MPSSTHTRAPKKFACLNCAGSVEVRAKGPGISAVCGHRHSVIDVNDPNLKPLYHCNDKTAPHTPAIAPGTKGVLRGHMWQVSRGL